MTHGAVHSGPAQGKCPPNVEDQPGSTCSVPSPSVYAHVHVCMYSYGCGDGAFCVLKEPLEGLRREGLHTISSLRSLRPQCGEQGGEGQVGAGD